MSNDGLSDPGQGSQPRWRPLSAIDLRVIGVLMEKAKTTPNTYPMSLSAVTTGCNQKSNRTPSMQLEPEDVEESLDRLREFGAVGLIEGYGRVSKYRHYAYDWLAVDKVEFAVVAELLLRGPQTEGELRSRAARMEPISDLAALRPILDSLKEKGLVIPLTPAGRGHVVAHALFSPEKLERIKAEYASHTGQTDDPPTVAAASHAGHDSESCQPPELAAAASRENEELRRQVAQLRSDVDDLTTAWDQTRDELRRLKGELGI